MLISLLTRRFVTHRAPVPQCYLVRLKLISRTQPSWRIAQSSTLTTTSSSTNEITKNTQEGFETVGQTPLNNSKAVEQDDGQNPKPGQEKSKLLKPYLAKSPKKNAIKFCKTIANSLDHQATCSGYGWTVAKVPPDTIEVFYNYANLERKGIAC